MSTYLEGYLEGKIAAFLLVKPLMSNKAYQGAVNLMIAHCEEALVVMKRPLIEWSSNETEVKDEQS